MEADLLKILNIGNNPASAANPSLVELICRTLYQLEHFSQFVVGVWIPEEWSQDEMSEFFLKVVPPAETEELVETQKELFGIIMREAVNIRSKLNDEHRSRSIYVSIYNEVLRRWYNRDSYARVQSQN